MAKRLIVPPRAVKRPPKVRKVTLDHRCVKILRLFEKLHNDYGRDVVIHAYAKERGTRDGNGWFEIRGLNDDSGNPKRFYVDWSDPRRRTEHMAHMGLLEWVNKNVPDEAGFRLNDDGYDFISGNAVVKKTSVYRGGYIGVTGQHGKRIEIGDVSDSKTDRGQTGVDD